ncbi:transcriptional regulator [Brenneria populi subsp. brevivirga]|uniref:helix-turn-helix domain-containing protein n=1 Tax=Brenneria populi TaxID=1505588 RepID=UPI002E1858EC|nr:transcriptional regulator [Brenneria populi subsp. brevivirga]
MMNIGIFSKCSWLARNAATLFSTPESLEKFASAIIDEVKGNAAVFAQYLHTAETTYQNGEQGGVKPNPQAVLLIKMVEKNPDTLRTLAAL